MRCDVSCFGLLLICGLMIELASSSAIAQSLARQTEDSFAPDPPAAYPSMLVSQSSLAASQEAPVASGNPSSTYQLQPLNGYATMYYSQSMTVGEAARQSLFGDVYAAGSWRPLNFGDFFSGGWNEPWAGGPAGGEGLTPRHGWLGANDGVLYRLWLNTFAYASGVPLRNGLQTNAYASTFSIFLPLSRRLEVLFNVPEVVSGSTANTPLIPATSSTHTNFGDLTITPRFLLQESERVSQVLALDVQTPTGVPSTIGGQTSLTPRYEFWTNPTGAWVTRGGFGVDIPTNNRSIPTFATGNLAIGRYLTSHDAPIGDLVFYGATTVATPLQHAGTIVTIGPGTRFHLVNNWFVLGFANFPVTNVQPFNYQTQVAIMKVF